MGNNEYYEVSDRVKELTDPLEYLTLDELSDLKDRINTVMMLKTIRLVKEKLEALEKKSSQ